jgi:O-antigen chain-terminating methyltransferase
VGLRQIEIIIDGFLATAESRSQVRKQLPDKYNRFPWILLKPLQWFILKVFNILFRDQRKVNSNLITALRESLSLNQQLVEQIKTLRSQSNDDLEHLTHILKDLSSYMQAINSNKPKYSSS